MLSRPTHWMIVIPNSMVKLYRNFPNPFNPGTTIRYDLSSRSHDLLAILNIQGQRVGLLEDGEEEAGYHEVKFDDGLGFAAGWLDYACGQSHIAVAGPSDCVRARSERRVGITLSSKRRVHRA